MCKITHAYFAYILTFVVFYKKSKKFVCVGLQKNTPKNEKIFSLLFIKITKNHVKINCRYL